MPAALSPSWWQHCVFYQIYPSSFADGNSDGVGDIEGILSKLDYLSWLGIDAIWLSPIYPSPMKDGGYDIRDYCDVDAAFGTLEIFDRLVAEAHRRNIKIILDWVPNHTSDQHPWFIESRSSRDNPKRNWYIWRDQPNNWQADIKRGSAWTLDPTTNQYYLHSYLAEQPDLNWDNPEVLQAMTLVLKFWLDRGVDGFRADAINMIAKDENFADWPEADIPLVHRSHRQNVQKVHAWLRQLRAALEDYPSKPVLIGELWLDPKAAVVYYGNSDELGLIFNFRLMEAGRDINAWKEILRSTAEVARVSGHWPSTVLSNHDSPRALNRMGSLEQAKAAAVLMLLLPGSPFMYAGDELGLADGPAKNLIDPGGRDGSRAPIPWDADAKHGWQTAPILPFPTNATTANYQAERTDETSILGLYRRLIGLYKTNANLKTPEFTLLDTPQPILAFQRGNLEIVVNFAGHEAVYQPHKSGTLVISSLNATHFVGTLRPFEAVVLRHDA